MLSPTSSLASLSLDQHPNLLRPSNHNLKRKRSPLTHPDDDTPPPPLSSEEDASTTHSHSPSPLPSSGKDDDKPNGVVIPRLPSEPVADSGIIRCICGIPDDDGLTIFCDMCGFWQHISCVLAQVQPAVKPADDDQAPSHRDATTSTRSPTSPASPPSSSSVAPTSRPRSPSKAKSLSPSSRRANLPSDGRPTIIIPDADALPEQWFCERCIPRKVDAAGARDRQLARLASERGSSSVSKKEDVDMDGEAGPLTPTPASTATGKKRGGGGGARRKSSAVDHPPAFSTTTTSTTSSSSTSSSVASSMPSASTSTSIPPPPPPVWGAPPPRRASTKANALLSSSSSSHSHSHHASPSSPSTSTASSHSALAKFKRGSQSSQHHHQNQHQQHQPPTGLSKHDEETLFEPWANEYSDIPEDIVLERGVKDAMDRWAKWLVDREVEGESEHDGEEGAWWKRANEGYPCPSSSSSMGVSPIVSALPLHPLFPPPPSTSSASSLSSTAPASSSSSSLSASPPLPLPHPSTSKRAKLQVRAVPLADCTPLPSPNVCPASPIVGPAGPGAVGGAGSGPLSAYPFPSPLSASAIIGESPNGTGYGGAMGMGMYTRPPQYGLYTNCPTAHAQHQQGLTLASIQSQSSSPLTPPTSSASSSSTKLDKDALLAYHTTPIPAGTLLAAFPSNVRSLEAYVREGASQYGLVQCAKPFVFLVGSLGGEEEMHPKVKVEDEMDMAMDMDVEETEDDEEEVDIEGSEDAVDEAEVLGAAAARSRKSPPSSVSRHPLPPPPPPLALALDAREMGGEARWARRGCWPNAVIRPVLGLEPSPSSSSDPLSTTPTLTNPTPTISTKPKGRPSKSHSKARAREEREQALQGRSPTLSFALFATRPIAPRGEEIVVGWEWDRGSAVHRLGKVLKGGLGEIEDEVDLKAQLSQILFTMGGTLTSCACSSSSSSSWSSSSSISSASAGSRLSAEPIRECTFVMMARFVAERSRFIGKPSAGLSGHGISSPSSSTMIAHHQRFASPSPLPASPSTPTPNHFVFSSPAPSSSTPGRKSSSSKLGGAALPKLSLEANFEKLRNASATASASGSSDGLSGNMELGPMVGWPEALGFAADPDADAAMEMEARKKFPVGILPGVSALSYFHAHSIYHPTTAASLRRFNSSSSSTSTSSTMGGGSRAGTPTTPRASSPAISLYRSMTPPPRSSLAAYTSPSPSGNWSGIRLGGSHSAPPHLTNPTTLLARTLATNGPVADAAAATTPTPAKRGWADVVGLHDRERDQMASASSSNAGTPPTTTKEYLRRSGSPTPSPSKRSSMPPSLGRGRLGPLASRMDVGKASPSLAKLDTASSLVSAPAPATPSLASPVHKKSGSMSLTSLNPLAASFAASLSSSLGLAVPEPTPATAAATSSSSAAALDADLASPTSTAILDESDADTTMEMEDVESIASAASTCELVDDASGSSESKAKLPPWARKRVRSTSFAAFSSPSPLASSSSSRHAFRDHAALNSSSSEPVGMGMGMSMSLPSSGLAMHSSIVPSEVIDEEMEDGTTGLIVPVTGTGTDSADAAGLEEEKTPVPTTTTSALSTGFIMDPSVMPPPPIPASLDPTTVTSIPAPSSPPSHFVPLESTTASSSVEMTDDDVEMAEEAHPEPSHESEPAAVDVPSTALTAPPPAPAPPAAPAVKMSFLDWKKKRDKAKVVEGDAAPASDPIPAPAPIPTSAPAPVPAPVSAPIFTSDSAPVDTSDTPAAEETSAIDNAPVSLTVPDEQHSAPTEIPEQARDDVDADVDSLPPSESVPVTSSELPLEAPTQPEDVQPESSDLTPLATAITSEPAPIPADIVAPVAEEAIERDVQSTSTLMAPPTPEPVFAADVATQEHEADDDMNMEEETTVEEVQTLPAPATLSPARPYTPSLPVDPLYPDEDTSAAPPQPIVKLEAVDLALADLSTPTIQPASDALMEDAEDGEILDSPGLSVSASSDSPGVGAPTSSLGSVLTRNSRSSTPASVSSRSSPPPQAPSPNIRRPSPGLRERDRPAIRKPPLAPSFGFAPGSPAESNSSVSDRDRDEYRYRAPPSSSSSYPAPPPSSSSYHGNSAGYNPYPPRRGMGYNQGPPRVPNDRWLGQRRGSPPPIIPRERDYDYPPPRPYGNGPPPPPNGWGNRGRPMQHPRRGFGGRGDYQDPSRSPNMRSSPDMNGFNPMGNKGRLPNGPSGPSSSFNRPSNGL